MSEAPVPVTVLTGYLGAGKTTLLNRILRERHGRRIAVIENDFAELGLDADLVVGTDEELIEMNNGCVCCSIRGDLIRTLHGLLAKRDRFDAVLIETTGLADPSPVAQCFFVDEELKASLALDAIVTLVDSKHAALHIESEEPAREQIAFADAILLNKIDLVAPPDADRLEARIRSMNALARIHRTVRAEIDLAKVLGLGAFDLSRKLELAPGFLTGEGAHHDPSIRSLSLTEPRALDGAKLNSWLGGLLKSRGGDIFRMKGIVQVAGERRRVVFQGVHMMFDGRPDRPWEEGEDRTNRLVFIGRNLPEAELRTALANCRSDGATASA
jgi:G3E family GTPase